MRYIKEGIKRYKNNNNKKKTNKRERHFSRYTWVHDSCKSSDGTNTMHPRKWIRFLKTYTISKKKKLKYSFCSFLASVHSFVLFDSAWWFANTDYICNYNHMVCLIHGRLNMKPMCGVMCVLCTVFDVGIKYSYKTQLSGAQPVCTCTVSSH